jgi:hypothetical protein
MDDMRGNLTATCERVNVTARGMHAAGNAPGVNGGERAELRSQNL